MTIWPNTTTNLKSVPYSKDALNREVLISSDV